MYIHVHKAAEPKDWGKQGGVMAEIKKALNINPNTSIEAVLQHVWACHQKGVVYNGKTSFVCKKRGTFTG
jgi:hypothetical protein